MDLIQQQQASNNDIQDDIFKNLPFINVNPEMIIYLRKFWFLYLDEYHHNKVSFLLVTAKGCPGCASFALVLNKAQKLARDRKLGPLHVYVLEGSPEDIDAENVRISLGISFTPYLFVVDAKGRMLPWCPNFVPFDPNDKGGKNRATPEALVKLLE